MRTSTTAWRSGRARAARLVPAYFCWGNPVAYADPELTPVLVYGLRGKPDPPESDGVALEELLGRTRARVLRGSRDGRHHRRAGPRRGRLGALGQPACRCPSQLQAARQPTQREAGAALADARGGALLCAAGGGRTRSA
ncbi:hypothetical protein GCM10009802_26180 [Streptomyces synnematoformans]|uniref:Uncharacterized protein n=1 Tax=Streptomyces synnematoformans TaxID=415721 RepID=A0ABN2Y647_9ACTN